MESSDLSTRQRRALARRRRILDIALRLAETEGWEAVTTRRLADAIDYSQPVIYQHFSNRDELIRTIATEGFVDLFEKIEEAANAPGDHSLEAACHSYIDFALAHPRLYEAMFTHPTSMVFAHSTTPKELKTTFNALADLVRREAPEVEPEGAAELIWACCHGLATLRLSGRIPPDRINRHIREVVAMVVSGANA